MASRLAAMFSNHSFQIPRILKYTYWICLILNLNKTEWVLFLKNTLKLFGVRSHGSHLGTRIVKKNTNFNYCITRNLLVTFRLYLSSGFRGETCDGRTDGHHATAIALLSENGRAKNHIIVFLGINI